MSSILARSDIVKIFQRFLIHNAKFPFHIFVVFVTCIDEQSLFLGIAVQAPPISTLDYPLFVLELKENTQYKRQQLLHLISVIVVNFLICCRQKYKHECTLHTAYRSLI